MKSAQQNSVSQDIIVMWRLHASLDFGLEAKLNSLHVPLPSPRRAFVYEEGEMILRDDSIDSRPSNSLSYEINKIIHEMKN